MKRTSVKVIIPALITALLLTALGMGAAYAAPAYTLTGVSVQGTGYEKNSEDGGRYRPVFDKTTLSLQWADAESECRLMLPYYFYENEDEPYNWIDYEPQDGQTYYFDLWVTNTQDGDHSIDFSQVVSSKVNVTLEGFELTLTGNNASTIEGPCDGVELRFRARKAAPVKYGITVNGGTAHADEGGSVGLVITSAAAGETVWLTGDNSTVPDGQYLYGWESEDVPIPNGYNSFTMPARAVSVSPVYRDRVEKVYDLTSGESQHLSDGDTDSLLFLVGESLVDADQPDSSAWNLHSVPVALDLDKNGTYDVSFGYDDGWVYKVLTDTNSVTGDKTFTLASPGVWIKSVTFRFAAAGTAYPVWVGSTQVTGANKDDIPGVTGGTASFDPGTNTLTFTGSVTAVEGTHQINGPDDWESVIGAKGISLTIIVNDSLTVSGGQAGVLVTDGGSLTIPGPGTLNAAGGYSGIGAPGLVISGGTVNATATADGVGAISVGGKCTISGGTVTADGGSYNYGIHTENGDIVISGGTVTADGGKGALGAYGHDIVLGSGMSITEPGDGVTGTTGMGVGTGAVILSGGSPAAHAKIEAASAAVYPVWVGSTQVTGANKDDILSDGGKARFDSGSYTLALADPMITGSHLNGAICFQPGPDDPNLLKITGSATINAGSAKVAILGIESALELNGAFTLTGTEWGAGAFDVTISGGTIRSTGADSGIHAQKTITVSGGEVTATGGRAGITTNKGSITISGGSVKADGTDDSAKGITADNGSIIISGGEVTASGKQTGILAGKKTVTITGGKVTATGSMEGTGDGAGISAGIVEITNATVIAKGRVYGISAGADISVSGQKVEAETWVENESQAIRAGGNITISGGTVTTGTAATGIRAEGNINIENGTQKVEADAKKHAVWADAALQIGDGLMIKLPAGGISDGNNIYEYGGSTEAVYALIVPKEALPKVTGVKAHVTGTEKSGGRYNVKTDVLEAVFESATAPVTLSASYLYTEQACAGALTTEPQKDTAYYFMIAMEAYTDGDPATVEWENNDVFINSGSVLTADNAEISIVELAHSPAGGSLSVICRYTPKEPVFDLLVTVEPAGSGKLELAAEAGSWVSMIDRGLPAGEQTVTAKAGDGYKFVRWVRSDDTAVSTGNPYTFALNTDTSLKAVFEAVSSTVYAFTKGGGAEWTRGSAAGLDFTVKGSPDDTDTFINFTGIQVDGAALDAGKYTAVAGSVNIGLKSSFLETLSEGSHTITAGFKNGSAGASFIVKADGGASAPAPTQTPRPVPKTGDDSHPALWIGLILLGAAGLAVLGVLKASRKRK